MPAHRKALLLGLGLQGHGALYDMLKFGHFEEIRVYDNRPDLESILPSVASGSVRVTAIKGEVSDLSNLERALKGVDVAICLLPRDFALPMAELAVETGVHYACASYMGSFCGDDESRARQKQRLEKLKNNAVRKGVVVLTQFGLDPGLDLLLAGEAVRHFDSVDDFISYGAGFPDLDAADNPLRYKFTWTVEGVMRSYFRPARIIRDSRIVDIGPGEIFAPENTHLLSVEELGGRLECFPNGDAAALAEELGIEGQVRSMGRYVCRWEGHCAFWNTLANCGFLKDESVTVKGIPVNKISFIASALSSEEQFSYRGDERDVTFTKVDIRGSQKGGKVQEVYQIIDKKDLQTGFTSMTRTVGFVVSLGSIMILNGELGAGGVVSPVDMPFAKTVEKLGERGIRVTHRKNGIV